MSIVIFAFDLPLAKAVCAKMREKRFKVRFVDAGSFSGEKEDGMPVLLCSKAEVENKHAVGVLSLAHVSHVDVPDKADPSALAKAVSLAVQKAEKAAADAEAAAMEARRAADAEANVGVIDTLPTRATDPPKRKPDPGNTQKD